MKTLILALSLYQPPLINIELAPLYKKAPFYCHFKETSGLRSKSRNRRVGGAKNSYHLHDRARDVVTNCKSWLIRQALLDGYSVIIYPGHVHIDNREKQACMIKQPRLLTYCDLRLI